MHPNVSIIVGAAILRVKDALGRVATVISGSYPRVKMFHINNSNYYIIIITIIYVFI